MVTKEKMMIRYLLAAMLVASFLVLTLPLSMASDLTLPINGDLFENAEKTSSMRINARGQAVWAESYTGVANASEIFFFDGESIRQLTSNGPSSSIFSVYPRINDAGQIVWRTTTVGNGSDIWFFDSDQGMLLNLTPHIQDSNHPHINNNGSVVFAGREFVPDNADIYVWDGNPDNLPEVFNEAEPGVQVFPLLSENGSMIWAIDEPGASWTLKYAGNVIEQAPEPNLIDASLKTSRKQLRNLATGVCRSVERYAAVLDRDQDQEKIDNELASELSTIVETLRITIGCL